ncbi:hypothetical protein LOZ12_005208 [Ophidiomyces ophidiicola]|nr:uncharacterized protein LOZ57_001180 [Ophidiomyces ophidiicola]KAI1951768.1 hypothetical protein LOZ57_001180 [Ophidiomyces ophidiicola]KAI2046835.1 hypothetical protein LOZ38_005179 [Ophidiomyces ophidiicola]KAI2058605.1 hypothetical protein LOZ43_002527 [Ophidiomyces ophidiicola]KAI2087876.1 hypothetical protein LOZ36_002556 [Ophidiomyces ophidiicola]KAI2102748.1 hypothetical protein LOZ34_005413 [Ophidiomyces ophidiicola]
MIQSQLRQFIRSSVMRSKNRFKGFWSRQWSQKSIPLFKESLNGTYEPIVEEDLFRYIRHRWLFNEQNELARRYLRFNVEKLAEIALGAAGNGARACVKVVKCVEGLHNKALILTMDNGCEVFAKLPNPNAGPAHYNTASEVATRQFLRDVAKIPVPRVLAWSSDPRNPAEAEYIIEEKAQGVRLGSLWPQWPRKSKVEVIKQIADMDQVLCSFEFRKHGSIYFKKDLPASDFTQHENVLINSSQPPDITDCFGLGPVTSAGLWKSGRADMDLDRGPWLNSSEYAYAMAKNEMKWILAHARPRMNYCRSMKQPEVPEDAISLLSKYNEAVPYLTPRENEGKMNVLWHPDLHLDNIFVDPTSHKITCIIDWQGATVAPLFYHSCIPRMVRHDGTVREGWIVPTRPDNFDTLSEDEKKKVNADLENETLHKFYEAMVNKRAPRHWAALEQLEAIKLKRNPTLLITGLWENRNLFYLRHSLYTVAALWNQIEPDDNIECPIEFTEEDGERHLKEDENITDVGKMLCLFRDERALPEDGMVTPEDFELAMKNCEKFKEIFLNLATSKDERELFSKLWPYQELEA